MKYGWCNIFNICGFNYCCSRNRDREECYAHVIKDSSFEKGRMEERGGGVDSQTTGVRKYLDR